ncbi:hypothetical protein M407DRAFT_29725 [Tulasnella calospora MUT 4182]|uniref:Protein kinase domain-containing protein n=1 Tax=Tulasnella calospora MUT 4182 TaxID=1051891 RepID=A0A0C3Q9K4_9AGAM|nr:hypothetical protein M407DRAFT_29725 [Tulasnella calospora MUT 4182]
MSSSQDGQTPLIPTSTLPLAPGPFNDPTEGQPADPPLSTEIPSYRSAITPPMSGPPPATHTQSTPMHLRVSSSRSLYMHKRSDLNKFLTTELKNLVVSVDVESFLQFAGLHDLWSGESWQEIIQSLSDDSDLQALKQEWINASPELSQYEPFCLWVESLLSRIQSLKEWRRKIRFTPLGNQEMRCTPGYADGDQVADTESRFKPDAACVPDGVEKLEEWWQVLVPIEFKTKGGAQQPTQAPRSTSTHVSTCESECPSSFHKSRSKRSTSSRQKDSSSGRPKKKKIRTEDLTHRVESSTPHEPDPSVQPLHKPTCDDIQLARYAMETLAAVGDRTHVFGLAVNNQDIALWYFDRCGAIRSTPLDVYDTKGFEAFIKFLSALMDVEDYALGFNPFFAPSKPGLRRDLCEIRVDIKDQPGQRLKLSKVLDRRTGIVGRATLVYRAEFEVTGVEEKKGSVVLKSSWQHHTRRSEYHVLRELHQDRTADRHIVRVHAGWEQENTSAAYRRAVFGAAASIIRHDRALRHTVLEYLHPITKLSEPGHIPYIGWSVLKAIQFLNTKSWYHRDISISNMGFAYEPCKGVLVKLLDFDLSKQHSSGSDTPHWTGTLPFMAVGLLQDPKSEHVLGYDLEALIWCLLWIVRVYDDGKPTVTKHDDHPLRHWFRDYSSLETLATLKLSYLQSARIEPFTNKFYEGLDAQMADLAWTWVAPSTGWQNIPPSLRPPAKNGAYDMIYRGDCAGRLQTWMEEKGWDRPKRLCSCSAHYSEN